MNKNVYILSYNHITYLFYAVFVLNVIAILYCFETFTSAISIKNNVGVYINLISDDGNILPNLLIVPGLVCFPVNIFCIYLVCKAFIGSKLHLTNYLMFIMTLVLLGMMCVMFIIIIMVLSHSYAAHESLHDGITEAMNNYSSNSLYKAKVDKLQIKFQCCGSLQFDEWYSIQWYDVNLMKNKNNIHSTPFSCCAMQSHFTCIHHGIESKDLPYLYSREKNFSISSTGCTSALKRKKKSIGWGIIGRLLLLWIIEALVVLTMRLFQTAHSQEYEFNDFVTLKYKAWFIGGKVKKEKKGSKNSARSLKFESDSPT